MTFKPGESGNPTGRPKGIIDKRSELRSLLETHAKEIIEKLIERAKIGDDVAMRLCVDRLIPRVKPDGGINEGSSKRRNARKKMKNGKKVEGINEGSLGNVMSVLLGR